MEEKGKSDAQATFETALLKGMSQRAHLTGVTADTAHLIVEDITSALFGRSMIWALKELIIEKSEDKTA